jgi:hypothetical protein
LRVFVIERKYFISFEKKLCVTAQYRKSEHALKELEKVIEEIFNKILYACH